MECLLYFTLNVTDYNDSDWEVPQRLGKHGMKPWDSRPHINGTAQWVWLPGDMEKIFCRLYLKSKLP